jgi:type IV pilus assembly protein PilB
MSLPRVRLGELLVDARVISHQELEQVLARQTHDRRRLGVLLVEAGLVNEIQVTQLLSQQLSVPWVSLHHIDFSRQLLNLVPRELSERHCLVPIFVRRVRGVGETLYVATDDPDNDEGLAEVSRAAGLPVRSMIAPPSHIRAAIAAYYGEQSELGQPQTPATEMLAEPIEEPALRAANGSREQATASARSAPQQEEQLPTFATASVATAARRSSSVQAELPIPTVPPNGTAATQAAAMAHAPSVADRDSRDSAPEIEAREIEMPAPRHGGGARMVTLTLLDGTRIILPARRAARDSPQQTVARTVERSELTARDLVLALTAASHGADLNEILGENVRWEAVMAALLSVMMQKQLIADWEFVQEYKKI